VTQFLAVTLNGLTLSALYFIVASGFTLVFGLMRNINLAHGSLYLLGAYLGFEALELTGSWVVAVATGFASMALVGVALVVARLALSILGFVPLLGQLLGMFLHSLFFGLALLAALAVARRMASPFALLGPVMAPARLLELAVVLVPLGLIEVLRTIVGRWVIMGSLMSMGSSQAVMMSPLISIVALVGFALLAAWVLVKLAFAPFYIAAMPEGSSAAPFARMKQSMALSRGKSLRLVIVYLVIQFIGAFFNFIPLLGDIIIAAALTVPLQLCAIIVIYHRLTGRPLEGLTRKSPSAADTAAEDVAPI